MFNKFHYAIGLFLISLLFASCITTKSNVGNKQQTQTVADYKYIFIAPATGLSRPAYTNPENNRVIPGVEPADIIKERAIKAGFIIAEKLNKEINNQMLIVNFGESSKHIPGRPKPPMEVRIQFVNANNYKEIYSCVAKGIGETESQEIEDAINKCLDKIWPQ